MACSCRSTDSKGKFMAAPVQSFPHEVLPGESCIYCADKHLSTAYSMLMAGHVAGAAIGELELARRHTAQEYPELSQSIARLEHRCCLREDCLSDFDPLLKSVADHVSSGEPEKTGAAVSQAPYVVKNPLVGEICLCAAWRLAFEVGYMIPNRSMIIGDLVLAREQLVRFDYGMNTILRDLRHRVQTTRASDLDVAWTSAVGSLGRFVEDRLDEYRDRYSEELAGWLNIIPRV